jgi:hypothetical protein
MGIEWWQPSISVSSPQEQKIVYLRVCHTYRIELLSSPLSVHKFNDHSGSRVGGASGEDLAARQRNTEVAATWSRELRLERTPYDSESKFDL